MAAPLGLGRRRSSLDGSRVVAHRSRKKPEVDDGPGRLVDSSRSGSSVIGLLLRTEDEIAEGARRFGLHAGKDVSIDGHRKCGRGVAESFAHDLDRYARAQQQAGMAMAEVMQTNYRQAGIGRQSIEGLAEQVGVGGSPLGAREHKPVVFVGSPEGQSLLQLTLPPRTQDTNRPIVEVVWACRPVGRLV